MRVVVDYRPALRERTGVGEYMHNLVRAYTRSRDGSAADVAVFTSSWKDRPHADTGRELAARVIDRRVPVKVLNYLWHRAERPAIEHLGIRADVVHAAHPLLIPSRRAAQVVTVHDLFFLSDPEAVRAEIRRDYPTLAPRHASRADAIVVNSNYTARQVEHTFGVSRDRIHVCSPGAPQWQQLPVRSRPANDGYVLFVGTLEPRKNVGVLLDAYERLVATHSGIPPLVLAGKAGATAGPWLDRLSKPPLAGHVRHLGYVPLDARESLYAGARLLVMPSRDEGFGIPVLEAMSAGVPVIAANRGALPEVLGDAGVLIDGDDPEAWARSIHRIVSNDEVARDHARRGLARAAEFSWEGAAAALHGAYTSALENRRARLAR